MNRNKKIRNVLITATVSMIAVGGSVAEASAAHAAAVSASGDNITLPVYRSAGVNAYAGGYSASSGAYSYSTLADYRASVRAIQHKLHITEDGIYGNGTAAAVKRFQASHGLAADGVVGPRTASALGLAWVTSKSNGSINT